MPKRLLAAGTMFAALLLMPGPAVGGPATPITPSTDCLGLSCAGPGSRDHVPEARAEVPSIAGPEDLVRQPTAGFYEYGRGTTLAKRAVAYVVPPGQSDAMPASVLGLPEVRALKRESPNDFDRGTVVIFGPDASLLAEARAPAKNARVKGIFGRTAAVDSYQCSDSHFCLYTCMWWDLTYDCWKVQFSGAYNGTGWHRLGDYGFNDVASSQRNRRDRDGLLAQHWPAGGTQYCADSHSSDATLSNNPIGNNQASAFANVPDDIHC